MHPAPLISSRQLLLKAFRMLPEEVSWAEILKTAHFVAAVQHEIEEADQGEPVPQELVQRRLKEIEASHNK